MNKKRYYYLIEFQYLGFRYHGWQKQEGVKTVQRMIDRTLNYVLDGQKFRTIASGRTDAMVSVSQSYFELFTFSPVQEGFFELLNQNLPADIRALSVKQVDASFNIIQTPKKKEYNYYFTLEPKIHPFAAPFLVFFNDLLDIDSMKEGARIFEGEHDLRHYCYKPQKGTKFVRTIDYCEILLNDKLEANFFPKTSFYLKVIGEGFMRYQIRLMMGALVKLGRGDWSLEELKESIHQPLNKDIDYFVAPASGLILSMVKL